MREQIEGSLGVARAVARCRPDVICAYPISPQTHIVEALGTMVRAGDVAVSGSEFVNVESEFAAMSVAIGASAVGARAYTATASQGLLYMSEAVFNAAGLGLPIVMTVANRAVGAPINIWNDHSDSMSQRDSGWIQLYAEDNQHAVDLHIQAFRIAERTSVPVMVCMDGFVLTHAFEPVDVPAQAPVDEFLTGCRPSRVLDPDRPGSLGAMVGPEAFTEVRYLAHRAHLDAVDLIDRTAAEYAATVRRDGRDGAQALDPDVPHGHGGLVGPYRIDGARTVVVALGSILGTVKDAVDELRATGSSIGVVGLTAFRPFPFQAVGAALATARRVVVLERAFSVGVGGIVTADVARAIADRIRRPTVRTVVAGLGGRAVSRAALCEVLSDAMADRLDPLTFLGLDRRLLSRSHRSGPREESA